MAVHSDLNEIILSKLASLESHFSKVAEQVTELRVAAITDKHIAQIEKKIDDQNDRIRVLEELKTKAITLFTLLNSLVVVIWTVVNKFISVGPAN